MITAKEANRKATIKWNDNKVENHTKFFDQLTDKIEKACKKGEYFIVISIPHQGWIDELVGLGYTVYYCPGEILSFYVDWSNNE